MRRIGILSASSGAGSRFFAANFACFLAEEGRRPAVLELAEPGLYDALGMDKRFAGRSFFPQGGPPNPAALTLSPPLLPFRGKAAPKPRKEGIPAV